MGIRFGAHVGVCAVFGVWAARVKGTFGGTLQPQPNKPATAPMVVTDGSFDVGTGP